MNNFILCNGNKLLRKSSVYLLRYAYDDGEFAQNREEYEKTHLVLLINEGDQFWQQIRGKHEISNFMKSFFGPDYDESIDQKMRESIGSAPYMKG